MEAERTISPMRKEVGDIPEPRGSNPEAALQRAGTEAGRDVPDCSDESGFQRVVRNFTPSYVLSAFEQTTLPLERRIEYLLIEWYYGPDGLSLQ